MTAGTTATNTPPAESGTSAGTYQTVGMSIPAAAAALGVSPNTIRAMIKRGQLRAERIRRPQGYTLQVFLDGQVPTAGTTDTSEQVPAAATYQAPTNDLQRAEALAAYGASLLAPVLATIERLEAENRAQAEEVGRLRAEVARQRQRELVSGMAGGTYLPPRPWWARWAWWRRQ